MKGTRRGALTLVGASVLAAGSACVDLFHSTSFETLCDVDATACGAKDGGHTDAPPDVVDAGPTDFCLWSSETARSHATHACAWLGACTAPFDQNAFGQCMIDAILAYDCNTNPNQAVAPGPLHQLWDALWQARSCAAVSLAVNPVGVGCSGTGFACVGSTAPGVYLECVDGVGGPESCLVEGRVCSGATGCKTPQAIADCKTSRCDDSVLHDCEGKVDLGYDCKYFGAGHCVVADAGPTCEPSFVGGSAGPCDTTHSVICSGDRATSCPTGESVSVDCANLTGKGTCVTGTPAPVGYVAGQCQGPGGCTPGCAGDTLTGCAEGASFKTSCASQGLGACHAVKLADESSSFACEPPGSK